MHDTFLNDSNGAKDVFVRDLDTGAITLVSATLDGSNSGNGPSDNPAISVDGRYVVFQSEASDLVANDTNGATDVFLRDLVESKTTLISATDAGLPGNAASMLPSISADGKTIVFQSLASDLTDGDYNQMPDVFAWMLSDAGPAPETLKILTPSLTSNGLQFRVQGPSGSVCLIQASPDLKVWAVIRTNLFSGGIVDFSESGEATAHQQFYRAVIP